jgi:4-hydroxybenzoate polyprenyltransferase
MKHLKIFIELTRLNKANWFYAFILALFLGVSICIFNKSNYNLFIIILILFFLGSVLMRSAGCIVNDIVDKDFDKKVKRTKTRPIAAGKISIKQSLLYVLILCV